MEVVLALITALVQLFPEIESVLPVIEKIINGQTATEADAAVVQSAITQLEQIVAQREAAAGAK